MISFASAINFVRFFVRSKEGSVWLDAADGLDEWAKDQIAYFETPKGKKIMAAWMAAIEFEAAKIKQAAPVAPVEPQVQHQAPAHQTPAEFNADPANR